MAKISSIKLPNNSVYEFKDNGALQLTGGTVIGPVNFNNSISAIDITTGDFIATGNTSFTNPINGKIKVAESLPVGPIEVGGSGFTKAFKKTLLMCLGRSNNVYISFIHGTTAPTIEGQKIGTFFGFQINAPILYQDQADYESGSIIPAGVCKTTAENIDIRYMFNVDENWGTVGKPLYLVGRYQRYDIDKHYFYIGGYDMGTRLTLCTNTIPVEDPPYGSDSTVYLYLGQMTSSYQFTLSNTHPLYTYKGDTITPLNTKKLTLDDISEPLHGEGSQNGANFVRKYFGGNLYVDRNYYLQSNNINTSYSISRLESMLDGYDEGYEQQRLFVAWHTGLQSTLLYQRGVEEDQDEEYFGAILRWGGSSPYLYMLRHNDDCDGDDNWGWVTTSEWEKISAGYADSAGTANTATKWTSAQKVYVALGTASTTTAIQGGNPNAQTIGVNGVLKVANGGTNISSYAFGDLLYANGATSLKRLPGNSSTTRKFLRSVTDAGLDEMTAPTWDTVTKTDVGLSNVENTKLSTWAGSTYITTLGTITTGTWNGNTIAVAQGGTGKTTGKDAANYFLNSLGIDALTPVDADYYISQYVNGGTTTTTYHRRPMSALWTYIKGKTNTLYVPYNLFDPRASYGTPITSNSNLDTDYNAVGTYRCDQASTSQSLTGTVPVTSSGFKIFNIGGYGTKQRYQFLLHYGATDIIYRGSSNIDDSSPWSKWYKIVSLPSGNDNKTFSAVGSSTQPVYVNANGQVIVCTSYANATVGTADKLTTGRSLKVALNSITAITFDGSASADSIPVTGTLGVGNGGTGKTTFASGELLIGNGTSAIGTRAIDTSLSAGTTSTNLPTSKAVVDYISTAISASDAMIFKGTLGTGGTITALPNVHERGWTYRIITAGTYTGQKCEVGDLIIALNDRSSGTTVNTDWTVAQTNIDGAFTTAGGTINGVVTVDNSFYANSATLGNLIVNGASSFVDNMQVNSINGVAVGASPKFTDTTYTFDGTYNASTNKAATVSTVTSAINNLDGNLNNTTPGASKTLTAFSQTDGKVSATFGSISITKSQVSDFPTSMTPTSHTHGNITNDGKITSTATIASGDRLVIVDTDTTANSKITGSSITFGADQTKFLTNKGTWGTPGGTYSLPLAASGTRGGIQIGFTTSNDNRNYAVLLSSEKAYVNVPWTNTTYSIGTGDNNGQIKVTPSSGTPYNVSVKGLGSNAYTSTAYLPLSGGTVSGWITMDNNIYDGEPCIKYVTRRKTPSDSSQPPGWAYAPILFTALRNDDNTFVENFAVIGAYGKGDQFKYLYLGGSATGNPENPWQTSSPTVKIYPTGTLRAKRLYIDGNDASEFFGGLQIKGHIAGDSATTGHGLYSGGGYHNAYNNIILHGDATTGSSGIAFISDKNGTQVNQPSDRAFIQFHAMGVTTVTAEGTAPTLGTTGETNRLVIGVGNDATDQLWLQTPGTEGLRHLVGTTQYTIPAVNSTVATANYPIVTTTTKGIYTHNTSVTISGGTITATKFIGSLEGNASNVSGTVTYDHGGTGIITYTKGDMIFASANNTLSKLAGGTTNNNKVLKIVNGVPAWSEASSLTITMDTTDTKKAIITFTP